MELLRSEAAFLIGPVLLAVAMGADTLGAGIRTATLITVALAVVVGAVLVGLLLLGGRRPHRPDLQAWLEGDASAFDSPPVVAVLRAD